MANPAFSLVDDSALVAWYAQRLAASDEALANTQPILRHLLGHEDHVLLSDRMVAQVRALLRDIAFQMLVEVETAAGTADPRAAAEDTCDPLALSLAAQPLLLSHAHALAFEWILTERLAARFGLDPVLSPLLQELIGSSEADLSANAMKLLAAQARFGQAQRRGELPLGELPGDLLHAALIVMRTWIGENVAERDACAALAERAIRARVDEAGSRIGLLERLVAGLGDGALAALDLPRGGAALFATALALGTGQERDRAVMTLSEGQVTRLALSLLACGARPEQIETLLMGLHPDAAFPDGIAHLRSERAAVLLADADR